MLLAPTLGMLVFAALSIEHSLDGLPSTRRADRGAEVMSAIDDVIAALQKERGLSVAFVRSQQGRFGSALKTQRQATDLAVATYNALPKRHTKALNAGAFHDSLANLTTIRGAIDTAPETDAAVAYTNTIATGLHLVHRSLRHVEPGAPTHTEAFMALNWSQEAAGRQRATLTGMLAAERFSLRDYLQLSENSLLFDQKLVEFEYSASEEDRRAVSAVMLSPAFLDLKVKLARTKDKLRMAEIAGSIRQQGGFQGLIHNFKNYVLRGEAKYRQRFNDRYSAIAAHIEELYALADSPDTLAQVTVIKRTFSKYRENLDVVTRMHNAGNNVREIDAAVQVDDAPIAQALTALETSFLDGDLDQWWRVATTGIDLIVSINAKSVAKLQRQTAAASAAAGRKVLLSVCLAALAVLTALLLGWGVLRTISPLQEVTHRLNSMARGQYDADTFAVEGTDEISELASAYNALTEGLERLAVRGTKVARGDIGTDVETRSEPQRKEGIDTRGPLAESIAKLEHSQARLGVLAMTIADDDLQDPILDEEFNGVLGEAFSAMTDKLRILARQAQAIADGDLQHSVLSTTTKGDLGTAFHEMIKSLKTLAAQVQAISAGDLSDEILDIEVAGDLGGQVRVLGRDLASMHQQLLAAERMSSMGAMAAGIGHEINNPLSYVLANITWVREQLQGDISEDLLEALDEATQGAERVRDITRDLNVFTRTQSDSAEPTNIIEVIESSIRMAHGYLFNHANLRREFDDDLPLVSANSGKLGQVLLNLIVNAAQSIPKDGPAGNIVIKVSRDGSRVVVAIADDGAGIPPEIEERIFEPFFSTKRDRGTGLGLAICNQIITSFGGEIGASRNSERGATFTIALPMAPETANARKVDSAEESVTSAGPLRVLIVDDDKRVAKTMARILRSHDVTVVYDGRNALNACSENDYDVVFCDLMMPGMTGMQFHAHLHEQCSHLATKVIFLTGGAFTSEMQNFVGETDQPVLHKPVMPQEVVRHLAMMTQPS